MLHGEQLKAGRDLQRRIEKLKEEGKDPLQPQPMATAPAANAQPRNPAIPAHRTVNPPAQVPGRIESPQPLQRMTDTVDESFMLLGGQRVSISALFVIVPFHSRLHCNPFILLSMNLICSPNQVIHSINSGT